MGFSRQLKRRQEKAKIKVHSAVRPATAGEVACGECGQGHVSPLVSEEGWIKRDGGFYRECSSCKSRMVTRVVGG